MLITVSTKEIKEAIIEYVNNRLNQELSVENITSSSSSAIDNAFYGLGGAEIEIGGR